MQKDSESFGNAEKAQELSVPGGVTYELPQSTQLPAQWAIREDQAQRSLDSGAHWKSMFKADHPLLCVAATTTDVWAGGKDGILFHSANSGVAWSQVRPSINGQSLSDDITHIDLTGATQVVVSTSNSGSWVSADGGKTWQKQ